MVHNKSTPESQVGLRSAARVRPTNTWRKEKKRYDRICTGISDTVNPKESSSAPSLDTEIIDLDPDIIDLDADSDGDTEVNSAVRSAALMSKVILHGPISEIGFTRNHENEECSTSGGRVGITPLVAPARDCHLEKFKYVSFLCMDLVYIHALHPSPIMLSDEDIIDLDSDTELPATTG